MKWIKCSEQMPKELTDVLVSALDKEGQDIVTVARWRYDYIEGLDESSENKPTWVFDCAELNVSAVSEPEVIYWAPLPNPPCPLYDPPNNCNCHARNK